MAILVTGGAGFIGSNFIKVFHQTHPNEIIVNLDKLTYAGRKENLNDYEGKSFYHFIKGDICDSGLLSELLQTYKPRALIHFAAESHVDRSITNPESFVLTNVLGTFRLLEESKKYWTQLSPNEAEAFRFLHVSTDEVYGTLELDSPPFTELTSYQPNSPYSASKASSDHFVRAYFHTYQFPVLTTNCSNNYGPYQYPEKLIPLCLSRALEEKPLPIYGDGAQIRDWLFVEDHCLAILKVLDQGKCGETYNIGGWNEKKNLDVITTLCEHLDELKPRGNNKSYKDLITFVKDRPGHDRRYAINANKIKNEIGWVPQETFETGLLKTIKWYLEHEDFLNSFKQG